ncbi:hypothetical protein ACFVVQ_12175 [Paenibacillus chitinolyticus]|uniref:hypothetical protein n=1 Tax=Paenibacillus chitinolyticus TaxID=79263 RepID=UPI0036DF3881
MEEFANHSEAVETAAPEMNVETTPETSAPDTATMQEQPKGYTVKYNKEERFVSDDEAPGWIQKGLNYDKMQERVQQYETQAQMAERLMNFHGFDDFDEFKTAMEEAEKKQEIREGAKRLGMDEELYRQHLAPVNEKLQQYERELQELRKEDAVRRVEGEMNQLRAKYSDFDEHQETVIEMVLSGEVRSLEQAYKLATYEKRIAAATKQAQQETIKNIQQNNASSTGALGQEGSEEKFGYSNMSPADKRKLRERVLRGEVVELN